MEVGSLRRDRFWDLLNRGSGIEWCSLEFHQIPQTPEVLSCKKYIYICGVSWFFKAWQDSAMWLTHTVFIVNPLLRRTPDAYSEPPCALTLLMFLSLLTYSVFMQSALSAPEESVAWYCEKQPSSASCLEVIIAEVALLIRPPVKSIP